MLTSILFRVSLVTNSLQPRCFMPIFCVTIRPVQGEVKMKRIFLISVALLFVVSPAFSQDLYPRLRDGYFDDIYIRIAVGNLLAFIEGSFGALVMVVAGIIALIAAVMGNYKAALGMLVIAIGAFILRSLVSLFFGSDFPTEGINLNDYSFLLQDVRSSLPAYRE